ncbi:hypothetical protein G3T36_02500 [Diaminobutyricibacter tongyongensis]|uniref:Uncharacterized protein n=1 Tax=Leifsonia tongyongensis TaxID=1268043 RepID=A0A6L9XTK2_9MICO|nr:hypothetical protein [Diaminobutyricibacter tongyongensis]NEN04730.1 hypothetical protein [Diaminobutyricibacter tongyongensis]
MLIRGLIQSTVIEEITAEADDLLSARAQIAELAPAGYELLQVHDEMPTGGRVIATGHIRLAATREIEATGPDYKSSHDALLAEVPEGHRLLEVTTVE